MDSDFFALEGSGLRWFLFGSGFVILCWAGWLWANFYGRRLERREEEAARERERTGEGAAPTPPRWDRIGYRPGTSEKGDGPEEPGSS